MPKNNFNIENYDKNEYESIKPNRDNDKKTVLSMMEEWRKTVADTPVSESADDTPEKIEYFTE